MTKIQHIPSSLFDTASRAICNQDCGQDKILGGEEGGKTLGILACVGNGACLENSTSKILMELRWHTIFASDFMAGITAGNERSSFLICLRQPKAQKIWIDNRQMNQMMKVFPISIRFIEQRCMTSEFMTCKLAGFT